MGAWEEYELAVKNAENHLNFANSTNSLELSKDHLNYANVYATLALAHATAAAIRPTE